MSLYPHNQIAYNKLVLSLKTHRKACIIQPTGTGKSFIVAQLIEDNPQLSFLIISSTSYIKNQFIKNFSLLKNFKFITYHSLNSIEYQSIIKFEYDYIILDEFHRAGATLWNIKIQDLLEHYSRSKIVGLTATPVRYLQEYRDLPKELFDDNVVHNLTLPECFDKGILTRPKYISAIYDIANEYDNILAKIKNSTSSNKSYLLKHILEKKLAFEKSSGLDLILKKHISTERNFIIFCSSIEQLNTIVPFIEKCFKTLGKVISNKVYSTLDESEENFESFKQNTNNESFNLLFSVNLLNEGIHVPNVDGVIFIRNTESHIIYYQQLGRCLESKGKRAIVFDLVNNFKVNNNNIHRSEIDHSYTESLNNYNSEDYKNYIYDFNIIDETKDINDIFKSFQNNDFIWNEHFRDLQDFFILNNRLPISSEIFNDFPIGSWCNTQRLNYNKEILSYERIKSIKEVFPTFFSGNINHATWESKFALFYEFFSIYDRYPISTDKHYDFLIGAWYQKQKANYKRNKLEVWQLQKILKSFPTFFENNNLFLDEIWQEKYSAFKEFYTKYNKIAKNNEIYKDIKISVWYKKQKNDYLAGKLDQYKIEKLLKIDKDIFDSQQSIWDSRFALLKNFKKQYNILPQKNQYYEEYNIGIWLSTNRILFNKGKLDDYRIKKLKSIDINILNSIKNDYWQKNKILLEQYYNANKRIPKKSDIFKGQKIGAWLNYQIKTYNKGNLKEERRDQLLAISPNIFDSFKPMQKKLINY